MSEKEKMDMYRTSAHVSPGLNFYTGGISVGKTISLLIEHIDVPGGRRDERIDVTLFSFGINKIDYSVHFSGNTGWSIKEKVITVSGVIPEGAELFELAVFPFSMFVEALPQQEEVEEAYRRRYPIRLSPANSLYDETGINLPNFSIIPTILEPGIYGYSAILGVTSVTHGGNLAARISNTLNRPNPILELCPPTLV